MDTLRAIFTNEIFIQAIGFVGMTMGLIATQCKSYQNISRFRILSSFIFGVQFILLGAYTGAATNIVSCAGNLTYGYRIRKGKSTLPFQILFGAIFVTIGIVTWGGPASILAVAAKLISTVALGINSPRAIRILNCCSTPLWIVYDIIFLTIGGLISDSIVLVFAIVGVIRYDILGKKRETSV
ncbi:MAG: YgjV family protein [Clostridia bacterium]|nr:YgjV family protein [Clostridia bacterium]